MMAVQFQSARPNRLFSRPVQGVLVLFLVSWLNVTYGNVTDPIPTPKPGPGPTDPVPRPPVPTPQPPVPGPTPPLPSPIPPP